MLGIKTSIIVALLSLIANGAGTAGCGTGAEQQRQPSQQNQQSNNPPVDRLPTPSKEKGNVDNDLKILRQGGYTLVSEAFVAVARDAETYQELRRLDDNLPILDSDAFNGMAVVAAFLGQRRTGGYSVEITRSADGAVRISETRPPQGAMTTQVLSSPYKVVSVPIENERALKLDLDSAWKSSQRPYQITSGEFTMSGGFAGRSENMRLQGGFSTMRHATLATFLFDVKGTGGTKPRELKEVATGIVQENGAVSLARFNAGSLVEPPANLLKAKGQFTAGENELALEFESLPSTVADGYQGKGRLAAKASGPAPPKKAMSREDVM
jgi:PrcB C-terminal